MKALHYFLLFVVSLGFISTNSFAQAATKDTLYVIDFVLCKDVIDREPIDIVESYDKNDQTAWAFARIYNGNGLVNVRFNWFYEDEPYFEFDAKVGNSISWRTYSSVTLRPGAWRVEMYHPNGSKLREIRFHCSD